MKYRKKPAVIEAIQWNGENIEEVKNFAGDLISYALCCRFDNLVKHEVIIKTLEGNMFADVGDFIIKGVKGEVYPCKPDIFKMTYEMVGDNDESTKKSRPKDARAHPQ